MKIQIVSDLHLEFWGNKKIYNFIRPAADILCILGDLCCIDPVGCKMIITFFKEISPKFRLIIWVPGNHEYYRDKQCPSCTIPEINKTARIITKKFKNIKYLNCETIDYLYKKTLYRFIGCILWTHIPDSKSKTIEETMSDYGKIYTSWSKKNAKAKRLNYKYVNAWHSKCLQFIKSELTKTNKLKKNIVDNKNINNIKNIILTHHKPFLGKRNTPVQMAYESDQMKLLNSGQIHLWGYGHTHEKFHRKIGKTILYSLPKGYRGQSTGFIKNQSVNI
jgi:predicted phosphodiesterase